MDIEALNHQMHENILSKNKEAETEKYFGKVCNYIYFIILNIIVIKLEYILKFDPFFNSPLKFS